MALGYDCAFTRRWIDPHNCTLAEIADNNIAFTILCIWAHDHIDRAWIIIMHLIAVQFRDRDNLACIRVHKDRTDNISVFWTACIADYDHAFAVHNPFCDSKWLADQIVTFIAHDGSLSCDDVNFINIIEDEVRYENSTIR